MTPVIKYRKLKDKPDIDTINSILKGTLIRFNYYKETVDNSPNHVGIKLYLKEHNPKTKILLDLYMSNYTY